MVTQTKTTPTLYEWAGGSQPFERLVVAFYDTAVTDDLLAPLFTHMDDEHVQLVAVWLIEVFGGPKNFSGKFAHLLAAPSMIRKHEHLHITESQRARWFGLMLQAADTVGLPDDPEFRSAFVAYIEWGTRMAKGFSNGVPIPAKATVPKWGWGEAPPYIP
jgi:hemoglobin